MILFASDKVEKEFNGKPTEIDPRWVAYILQLAAMRSDLVFILTSLGRTPKHNKDVGGIPDSGHVTKPITAGDLEIRDRITQLQIDRSEKERIKHFSQFWWGDLFDFVIYDSHVHTEIDKPFRKLFVGKRGDVASNNESKHRTGGLTPP